jgi:hypothetical protein
MAGLSRYSYDPPVYCSEDGVKLQETTRHVSSGFDVLTGRKNPDIVRRRLVCPVNEYHPSWSLIIDPAKVYWYSVG